MRICVSINNLNSKILFGCILLLAGIFLVACEPQETETKLEEVTVQLVWKHQAQFAGLYAAEQNGYYAEEGIEVNFMPRPDPSYDVIEPLVEGSADFGITYGIGILTARSEEVPITAIATVYRRYPLAFIALEGSGITQPGDFPGHTMRATSPGGSSVTFQALMARLGIDPNSVEQVDVGFDLLSFFVGEVDIWPGFITNEVLTAREQGYKLNLILPDDYGVHLYGDTLFTTEEMIEKNPDLVFRFLKATLRGWRWAIENLEEAGVMALEYNPTLNPDHQISMLEASVPLVHTGDDQIGWMRAKIWQDMHDLLLDQELMDEPFNVDDVYTMEFLNEIYKSEP